MNVGPRWYVSAVTIACVLCGCAGRANVAPPVAAARGYEARGAPTQYQLDHLPITISATCLGYFSHPSAWYLSVNSAAQAELGLVASDGPGRRFTVGAKEWLAFRQALGDERFFEMADDYGNDRVVDGSMRTLTVSLGHMTKTVRVHHLEGRDDAAAKPAVRLLMRIRSWFADADAVDLTTHDKRFLDTPDHDA